MVVMEVVTIVRLTIRSEDTLTGLTDVLDGSEEESEA